MSSTVFLHPDVGDYLDSLSAKERTRCYHSLKNLSNTLMDYAVKNEKKEFHRLRVGNHRFLYVIIGNDVLVEEGVARK